MDARQRPRHAVYVHHRPRPDATGLPNAGTVQRRGHSTRRGALHGQQPRRLSSRRSAHRHARRGGVRRHRRQHQPAAVQAAGGRPSAGVMKRAGSRSSRQPSRAIVAAPDAHAAIRRSDLSLVPVALVPMALVPVVVACFWPVLGNGFVNWDDASWFTHNPNYRGLSPAHLHWMFTTFYMSHYQPLTWLSHAVVYTLWGEDPAAYHGATLALHAANALLVYSLTAALLRRARPADAWTVRAASAVGALVFAIHPLRVEAVAWAAERQEVLCGFFFLISLLAYLRMAERQAAGRPSWGWYVISLFCFALSLLSKAAGIMLPFALLVLDAVPLSRLPAAGAGRRRVLLEKLPFLLLALSAAVLVLRSKNPDTVTLAQHGVLARVAQALYGLCFYLWKTLVPVRLSPLYQLHMPLQPAAPAFLISAVLVLALTTMLIRLRRRQAWALAAWAWYVVMVLPLLGFGQAGPQLVADRYTYLACLPVAVLAAAGVHWAWRTWSGEAPGARRWVAVAGVMLALGFLGVRTYAQSRVWEDS